MPETLLVGPVEALKEGSRTVLELGNGRSIVVFNIRGTYRAMSNVCPHQGGPLYRVTGTTRAKWCGERGYRSERIREGEIAQCGWHMWEFDIQTGACLANPRLKIRTYPVRVVENSEIGPEASDPSGRSVVVDV